LVVGTVAGSAKHIQPISATAIAEFVPRTELPLVLCPFLRIHRIEWHILLPYWFDPRLVHHISDFSEITDPQAVSRFDRRIRDGCKTLIPNILQFETKLGSNRGLQLP
jgi:hypothetical protein